MIFTNLIETNLRTKELGQQIEYYQRIDSTNKEAWEIIDLEDITHGTIVITDNQLSGKGRNGNTWFMSPSKGLAMSIILKQSISIQDGLLIPIAAGVAIAKALENRGGAPKLKWPNDILINNKKCGGILCETRIKNNCIKFSASFFRSTPSSLIFALTCLTSLSLPGFFTCFSRSVIFPL